MFLNSSIGEMHRQASAEDGHNRVGQQEVAEILCLINTFYLYLFSNNSAYIALSLSKTQPALTLGLCGKP